MTKQKSEDKMHEWQGVWHCKEMCSSTEDRNLKLSALTHTCRVSQSKVNPSTSMMNFFPQWCVSCFNSLQLFHCTQHQNSAGSCPCWQNIACTTWKTDETVFEPDWQRPSFHFSSLLISPCALFKTRNTRKMWKTSYELLEGRSQLLKSLCKTQIFKISIH